MKELLEAFLAMAFWAAGTAIVVTVLTMAFAVVWGTFVNWAMRKGIL